MKNNDFSDIVEFFKKTYCFYRQDYVMMDSKFTKTVGHYYTDTVIKSHIEGKYALCVFAGPKTTRFLSVDIDIGGKKVVRQVMDAFERLGIPRERMYISTSGRKGYHVDIFFSPWLYNDKAKNLYELMIWKTGLDPKKVEYRPTATQAIKIPLGVHAKTGNRCWFLDRDTLQPIERLDYIGEIIPIEADVVLGILKEWNKKRWNELYADMICASENVTRNVVFDDAYYESHRITASGTRHETMVRIACDLRHYGANQFQIAKALRGFYYHQDTIFMESSEKEVLYDIDSIAQWAEESVPILEYRKSPNDGKIKKVTFDKYDAAYILHAPTSAARKVAFLIWTYCKVFGAARISYWTIADIVGCTTATAKTAVSKLVERKLIYRKSGGCHYSNGKLVRKSNTYYIPTDKNIECLCADAGTYELCERIGKENISSFYYRMLAAVCSPEYLMEFLTKTELEECVKQNGRTNSNLDAGRAP